jgi:uncharacterized membrane protein
MQNEDESTGSTLPGGLFKWVVLGIALILVGLLMILVASSILGGSVSTGVVIFIGPIPIVFGSGPDKIWLILIGVIITVISIVAFFGMNRRYKRT